MNKRLQTNWRRKNVKEIISIDITLEEPQIMLE